MIQKFELFNENVENPNWVGFYDYLNEDEKRNFRILGNTLRVIPIPNAVSHISADNSKFKDFVELILKDKRYKVLNVKNDNYQDNVFSIGSHHPYIYFRFKNKETIYIKTLDFFREPNKYIQVFVKEKIKYNPNDPFGEEDWGD